MNQVRNSWRYNNEKSREAEGFFDGSIWERSRRTGPDSLKGLIREGIKNTSVTCVLVGAATYERRWVRYELARSLIKRNGLLAVKIHLLGNQQRHTSHEGPNPLDCMGVYNAGGAIRLAELKNGKWVKYNDFTQAVDLPVTWTKPHNTNVIALSRYARSYCYKAQNGGANFSSWVREAAADAGK